MLNTEINVDLRNILSWIEKRDYKGIDHYDLYDNPLFHILLRTRFILLRKVLRKLIHLSVDLSPKIIKFLTGTKPNYNAKALGLILSSYCHLYHATKDIIYISKAKYIANLLEENRAHYYNYCWGYPFDWSGTIFIPKNTPSSVVTCIVGDGYFKLYKITGEKEYLNVCISICKFILEDLKVFYYDNNRLCFSYTPIDHDHVHNANLFASEFLIRIGQELNNHDFIRMGIKSLNFTLNEQQEDGSILYWGRVDSKQMRYRKFNVDHYHTGFEIRKLYDISKLLNDPEVERAYKKYYYFYKEYMIYNDGTVNYSINKLYPIDIHSCAEAIILNSHLDADENFVAQIINWVNIRMKSPFGYYYYKIQKYGPIKFKTRFPYMRWGQAWMLYALSYHLLKQKSGE